MNKYEYVLEENYRAYSKRPENKYPFIVLDILLILLVIIIIYKYNITGYNS